LWRRNIILHHLHGKTWSPFPVAPEIFKAFECIVAKCAAIGHIVEEDAPKYKDENLRKALLHVLALAALKAAQDAAAATGREMNADYLEPTTLSMVQYAQQLSAAELTASMEEVRKIRLAVGHFFQNYDLLLTPTLGLLPQPHGKYSTKRAMEPWEWIKVAMPCSNSLPYSMPPGCQRFPSLCARANPVYRSASSLPPGSAMKPP